jgi:hypothetical protein
MVSGALAATLQDRPLLATIVNAIKELASKVSETAHLFIATLTAHRVETQELCVGSTCVTEDQFKAALENVATGAGSVGGGPPPVSLPASGDAGTSSTTPGTDSSDDEGAADASSSGVAPAAPAASSTSEGTNADTVVSTMPDVTGAGTSNASAANDNAPPAELPATGTE